MSLTDLCVQAVRNTAAKMYEICPSWELASLNVTALREMTKNVATECFDQMHPSGFAFMRCMSEERILSKPLHVTPNTTDYRVYAGAAFESNAYTCINEYSTYPRADHDPKTPYFIVMIAATIVVVFANIFCSGITETPQQNDKKAE